MSAGGSVAYANGHGSSSDAYNVVGSSSSSSSSRNGHRQSNGTQPQQQQEQQPTESNHRSNGRSSNGRTSSNDTLILPKFRKNQRHHDYTQHHLCCDASPPGRADPSAGPGVLCRNAVGMHGFAAVHSGAREHMEDRHRLVYGRPDGLFRGFFGVFDGHGGEEASHFASKHLSDYVTGEVESAYYASQGMQPSSYPEPISLEPSEQSRISIDYKSALQRAFDRLEENVLRQSRQIGCRDGTTVTCCLVTHDTIYCANTGDSRTVLCRDNNAVALSQDHKPCSESERSRIIAAGGEVRAVMLDRAAFCCFKAKKIPHGAERLWPGGFSVSRAVGDIDFKDLRRKKTAVINVLIHRPDVSVTSVNSRDQFIICGSDGLWDVMTNQQACDFVLKELKKKKRGESMAEIGQKLAEHAYSLGSEDNITALVVFFVNHELPHKS